MSVAIATALTPDATIEDVIDNVLEYAWALGVITSYSIHYTKLYEAGP